MAFNAARQPFYFSALVSGLLAILFAVRYAAVPYPVEAPFTDGMPIAAAITGFSVQHPWTAALIAGVLLVWLLFVIVQLTVRYASAMSRNYLSMQFFMIAACGIVIPAEAIASYIAAFLLVLSTRQFISAFRKDYRFGEAFRAGFYLGFLPLFYAPSIILLLLIPGVMSLYRRSVRELVVCAVGALLPIPAAGFIYWAVGESSVFVYREIWRCTIGSPMLYHGFPSVPVTAVVVAGLVMLLVLAAVVWFLTHRKGMRTKQRKMMAHVSLMQLFLLLSLPVPGSSFTVFPLIAVSVAMVVPYSFSGKQAVFSSLLYCMLLLAVLALNLLPVLGISVPYLS